MIRFTNTRTGRSVEARDGRDLAHMLKIEQDRRSGIEAKQAATAQKESVQDAPQAA